MNNNLFAKKAHLNKLEYHQKVSYFKKFNPMYLLHSDISITFSFDHYGRNSVR